MSERLDIGEIWLDAIESGILYRRSDKARGAYETAKAAPDRDEERGDLYV